MGKPETSLTLSRITFSGGILEALRDGSGTGWLALKQACDAMGIDPEAQRKRLSRATWAVASMMEVTAADGKIYQTLCLRSDRVAMWLATLDARRIKDPTVRERIELWQQHAADALDKWVRGEPAAQPGHRVAIDDPVNTIKALLGSMKTTQDEARADRLEYFAEMRAQREERAASAQIQVRLASLVEHLAGRLLPAAPSVPVPAPPGAKSEPPAEAKPAPTTKKPRERYGTQRQVAFRAGISPSNLSRLIRVNPEIGALQVKRGRWPIAKTAAAIQELRSRVAAPTIAVHTAPVTPTTNAEQLPLPAATAKPERIYSPERMDLVRHMNVHALRNQRTETDQRSEDWQALYKRFREWSHYNPYEVGAGRKQPLDIVEERGHMGALLSVAQKLFPLPDQHAHAC